MCVGCMAGGMVMGYMISRLGFETPKQKSAKRKAEVLTAALITVTIVAMKTLFQTSPCGGVGSIFYRFTLGGLTMIPFALVYAIAANHFMAYRERYSKEKPMCCV